MRASPTRPAPPGRDPAPTDDELYREWALGDRRAGSMLVDRLVRPLARFFVNKVASCADAEDLTSETLEILARKVGEFAGRSSVRTWVFAIAYNVLRNHLRRRGGNECFNEEAHAVASFGPSPITALARRRELQRLLVALRAIPLMFQIVLELAYFEQLTRIEIADARLHGMCMPPNVTQHFSHHLEPLGRESLVEAHIAVGIRLHCYSGGLGERCG